MATQIVTVVLDTKQVEDARLALGRGSSQAAKTDGEVVGATFLTGMMMLAAFGPHTPQSLPAQS